MNIAPGATPKQSSNDPFVGTPSPYQSTQLRYATLDNDQFTSYSANSPAQARRALEAHLKETDRRIHDAAKLGNTLLEQKKSLSARLADIENVNTDDEVPAALRQKLAELEKEYNEVGRESARAFLPKLRASKSDATTLTAQGGTSPSKVLAPSRRQRNQPNARVHDIEFATEISTSLLAQVRQLQTALAEKDTALKDTASTKAQLEADLDGLTQKVKQMDERIQSFKDENWNLEGKIQELESVLKTSTDNEHRLGQTLKAAQTDKASAQRDLDELKSSHDKAIEAHLEAKRQQDFDLHGLRRDVAVHQADKEVLQKKIDELHNNNKELARAVSYRFNQPADAITLEDELDKDNDDHDESMIDGLDMSPVKGTPARPGMLESETLKSSLNHAHRMIQNLKNNIHREKTEKLELKRMLNDARDELEKRRTDGGARAVPDKAKKSAATREGRTKRPARLAANGAVTTEIFEDDPEWEEHDGEKTPSKPRNFSAAMPGAFVSASATDTETTDAFETADEARTATETEGFQTGIESMGDESDELTETEATLGRSSTVRRQPSQTFAGAAPGERRRSFESTASVSSDDAENLSVRTPSQSVGPKYRLRVSKSARRSLRSSQIIADSPSSNNSTPQNFSKSLGDELDMLDDDSLEGTPSRVRGELLSSPETQRTVSTTVTPIKTASSVSPFVAPPHLQQPQLQSSPILEGDQTVLIHDTPVKPAMVDTGMMTEPWQPETVAGAADLHSEPESEPAQEAEKTPLKGFGERLVGAAGGALAGFGLGRVSKEKTPEPEQKSVLSEMQPESEQKSVVSAMQPETMTKPEAIHNEPTQELQPAQPIPAPVTTPLLGFSSIINQDYEPVAAPAAPLVTPLLPKRSSRRLGSLTLSEDDLAAVTLPMPEHEKLLIQTPTTERSMSLLSTTEQEGPKREYVEPKVYGGGRGANGIPTLMFGGDDEPDVVTAAAPIVQAPEEPAEKEVVSDPVNHEEGLLPITKPLQIRKQMQDEGSQTLVSGQEIEDMMRDKTNNSLLGPGLLGLDADAQRSPKRPGSSGSTRQRMVVPTPPLPIDHTEKIAAAAKTPAPAIVPGSMGPPLLPASAYRNKRPTTPGERSLRSMSRDGTTPRPVRQSVRDSSAVGRMSRSTSVSSFASELDERFAINRNNLMYPNDVAPATDPRMIQAITQTMIGEYLWKYTRKAGRVETSSTRHRRFFWVHPYTRTLYWSEQDPSSTTKGMMKAKSVPIESVRVITDDNVNPPGLHRKSIIIVSRSREIVVTAQTSQRHETWFNALSYLLLRSGTEKEEAEGAINDEDVEEFNPAGFSFRRSISKMTRGRSRSRVSLHSYNSRATRNSSPTRRESTVPELAATTVQRSQSSAPAAGSVSSRTGRVRDSSRFSTMASRFVPSGTVRSSVSSQPRAGSSLSNRGNGDGYDASVINASAENVRQVIEQQDRDADMLENVRACCDGKHDVGSLSRSGKHASLRSRLSGSHHSHQHSHASTQSKAEPAQAA